MNKILIPFFFCIALQLTHAQGVGIGTTTPNSSSILDVSSTSKGMLMPRMTTAQRDAIVSPAIGLQVLNMDDMCIDIYDGANWIKHCGMKNLGIDSIPAAWVQKASVGATGREKAIGFGIGNKGYFGTGQNLSTVYQDFWEFNPSQNAWTQKANFGGGLRYNAVGFAIGNKGFVGTGYYGDVHKDFWEYNPADNSWTLKDSLDGPARTEAVGFELNGKGYIGTGLGSSVLTDFWEYNSASNTWSEKDEFEGLSRSDAVGFSINGKGYIGLGRNASNPYGDFMQYDPATNDWNSIAYFPGSIGYANVGFSINNYGMVGTGYYLSSPRFWLYNPLTDEWKETVPMPGANRRDAVGFAIGNKAYVGTGYALGFQNDFWEYSPAFAAQVYQNSISIDSTNIINDGIWTREIDNVYNSTAANIGIGIQNPSNKLDIQTDLPRTGSHADGLSLYVTGDFGGSSGVEFRHHDGTQGIGFGYNTISAAGSNLNVDLGMLAKGATGVLKFSTNANERMRIDGAGSVGIGNSDPHAPLHFNNANDNRKLVVNELVNNDHQFYGIGSGTDLLQLQVGATSGAHAFFAGTNATTSVELMRITGNGNVGIGNSMPHAPLQFTSADDNRKLVVNEVVNNDHQFYGLGSGTNQMRYQIGATTGAHTFFAGANATTSNELMRITGTGNIGIGSTAPHAPLQFSNTPDNRKIVLTEIGNNDHQFYGLGSDSSQLRFQAHSSIGSFGFYAGSGGSNSNEVVRITGTGRIGIGVKTPNERLEVGGDGRAFFGNGADTARVGLLIDGVEGSSARIESYDYDTNTGRHLVINSTGGGFVGINEASPHAQLHLSNTVANRKLILYETANNQHQFYGFGINTATLRYQVPSASSSHVFFTGATDSTSTELMRIKGDGNVGIGITNPLAPLHFNNAADNRKIVLSSVGNNDHQFYGFGTGTNLIQYQAGATSGAHAFFAGANSTTSNELMRIKGDGNVGIGNTDPHAPLHFNNANDNRKLVVNEVANNDHQFYGLGSGTDLLQFQVAATTGAHVFFAGTNSTTSVELMRITGTGNVGIGIPIPTQKLHVVGNAKVTGNIMVDGVIENESITAGTLQGTYTQNNDGYAPAGFYKDKEGKVILRGTVEITTDPTNTVIFTLPVGYRPSTSGHRSFVGINNNTTCRIDVLSTGEVKVIAGAIGSISLDGISFRAD